MQVAGTGTDHAHVHRLREGRTLLNVQAHAGHKTVALQVAQQARVVIVDAFEHDCFAGFALAQRHGLRKTNMPRRIRDRVAVRVAGRVPQQGVDAVHHEVGYRVLQNLRLVVHTVPGVAEGLHEERLNEAVAADHCQRVGAAGFSELNSAVGLMLDQVGGGEALEAVRYRRNAQAHAFCQGGCGGRGFGPFFEAPDFLEVVLGADGKF